MLSLGLGLSLTKASLRGGGFSPSALFALAEPGVWYDPSDVANLAWRRNLLTYSEQFDNVAWVKTNVTVTTAPLVTDPYGGNAAWLLEGNATSGYHVVVQNAVFTQNSSDYARTFIVKKNTSRYCAFGVAASGFTSISNTWIFDLETGGITQESTSRTQDTTVDDLGSGWYRVTIYNVSSTGNNDDVVVGLSPVSTGSGASLQYNATGESIYIMRPQGELGLAATDYQAITTVDAGTIARFPNATLYQDVVATIPVTTPGQTVALMLDKSKGLVLGSELVTNGDFSSSTGWTLTNSTITAGTLDVNTGSSIVTAVGTSVAAPVGTPVLITFDVTAYTSGSIRLEYRGLSSSYVSAVGSVRAFGVVSAGGAVQFRTNGVTVLSIDNVSIKELPGNHAQQATLASRPTYGVVPQGGRRNILTFSEQFDNTSWGKTATTIDANVIAAPNGSMTADKLVETDVTSAHTVAPATFLFAAGTQYTYSVYVKPAERTWVLLQFPSTPFGASTRVWLDLTAGVPGFTQNCTPVITPVGTDGWYRCSITATTTIGGVASPASLYVATADTVTSYLGVVGSGLYIWGAQFEQSATASPYQRVTTQYDVTEAGVPSCSYLFFDGGSDFMETGAVNFTTTDKMTVFAGAYLATPQSNNSPIVQIGDTTTSDTDALMRIMTGDGSTASVRWSAAGTAANLTPRVAISYPNTSVYSATFDGALSGANELALRLNAADVAVGTATDSGITSIGSQVIYIGRQNTAVGFLNGNLFGLIVRGAASTTTQITDTEQWLAPKSTFFKPVITGVPTIGVS